MKNSLKKILILICVFVLSSSTFAQIKVINNKGTFFQVDTSKWSLVGVDIFNKNQIGNVGIGAFPYGARLVVHSSAVPALKLKYPFTGAISDSILTWNPIDSTVRKITLLNLLTGNTIRSLNGLTVSTQTFATGDSGSDFTISSSGSTHTFNIPNASSTNRGLLTNTDWITFNNKIGIVTATTPAAVTTVGTTSTILNTNAYWNANQLQGKNISTTAPTNGQVLAWNDTTSQWVPTSSTLTSTNGIDIGYIVAWGSNTTPPDYLLPLSGGTYNWADFPHFQAFQTTHPSQFITDNGTTFTLKDINTSGRFLRGGLTANVDQNGSTAMPINSFVLNNYTHNHSYTDINETGNLGTVGSVFWGSTNAITSLSSSSSSYSTSDNTHTHTLSGGDTETRPINTSVIWCLKVKPTSTSGNITINNITTSETTTNLTQNISTGQITYTNENSTNQTAQVVSSNSNNSINVGTDGGAYFQNPITNLTQNTTTGQITYTNENSTNQTAQVVSSNANNSIQVGTDGGAFYQKDVIAIDIYNSSSTPQTLTTGSTTLEFNYIRTNLGSAFVLNNNQITVNNSGTYRVTYSAGITNDYYNGEYTGTYWLEVNSTRLRSSTLNQNCYSGSISCATRDLILYLNAGDVLRVRMTTSTSNSVQTVPDCNSINIEKIK